MNKTVFKAFSFSIPASMALLAGCSGGLTEGDIEDMIAAALKNQFEQLSELGPAGAEMLQIMPVIHDAGLNGCEEIHNKVYNCNIEIDSSIGDNRGSKVVEISVAPKDRPSPTLGFRGMPPSSLIFSASVIMLISTHPWVSVVRWFPFAGTTQSAMPGPPHKLHFQL